MNEEEKIAAMEALKHISGKLKSYRGMVPAPPVQDTKAGDEAEEAGEDPAEQTMDEEMQEAPADQPEADDKPVLRFVEHVGPKRVPAAAAEGMSVKRGRGRPKKGY